MEKKTTTTTKKQKTKKTACQNIRIVDKLKQQQQQIQPITSVQGA